MDDKDTVFYNRRHFMFSHFLNIGTILALHWSSGISPLTCTSCIWSSLEKYEQRTPIAVLKLKGTNKYILLSSKSSISER